MKLKALLTLIHFATEDIQDRPAAAQVKIYQALADVLPAQDDRIAASRIAFALSETSELRRRFDESLHVTLGGLSEASVQESTPAE